jgi:hypothetical protein
MQLIHKYTTIVVLLLNITLTIASKEVVINLVNLFTKLPIAKDSLKLIIKHHMILGADAYSVKVSN